MATVPVEAFPRERFNRAPYVSRPAPPPQVVAVPPRSRMFTFAIHAFGNRRTTYSTPRLIGPLIVQTVRWKHTVAGDPPVFSLELGWSLADVHEQDVLTTAAKPWNAICERVPATYPGALTQHIGITQVQQAGGGNVLEEAIDKPILIAAPEMFLNVSLTSVSVAATGHAIVEMQVIEAVAPEVALNFH